MEAPSPVKQIVEENKSINLNELNNKYEFSHEGYSITIGIFYGYLILFAKSENNDDCFQFKSIYDQLISNIPNFKMISNLSDLLLLIKELLETNKYELKQEKNTLKIIIKLKNMLRKDEDHELILQKIDLDKNQKIEFMDDKIRNLENKISAILSEKEKLQKQIKYLIEENKYIKDDLNFIKKNLNINPNSSINLSNNLAFSYNYNFNNPNSINYNNIFNNNYNYTNFNNNINKNINSRIINEISDINFIFDEIKKNGINIKGMNLIFRASEEGDRMEQFNFKCNNKDNELFIIKTTKGYIFGGYTKVGWIYDKGKDIFDSNAFIFSYNLKKIYNIKNPQYALHCQSGDGRLSFGSSSYAILLGNNFLKRDSGKTDKMIDYSGESNEREINGGGKTFQVVELEVFQIFG